MNRVIKFRAWVVEKQKMVSMLPNDIGRGDLEETESWKVMQFTGLLDKNGHTEVYEGDIIDNEGLVIGNVYESPQVQQEGANHVIARMGTNAWRDTKSIAMGRGCKYAQ